MKKCNILKTIAAIVAVVGTAAILLYLFKDKLASCPLCQKFLGTDDEDDDDFFDDDFFEELEDDEEEEAPEEETEEVEDDEEEEEEAEEKETKSFQVRRGYIPLKFRQEEEA